MTTTTFNFDPDKMWTIGTMAHQLGVHNSTFHQWTNRALARGFLPAPLFRLRTARDKHVQFWEDKDATKIMTIYRTSHGKVSELGKETE